jgi:hypothetical protein
LFLPWFDGFSAMTGPAAHGYLWLVFALTIFALAVLVGRESIDRLPGNWPSVRQMLIGATGLALALSIRGLVMRPTLGFDGNAGGYLVAQQSYGGLICVLAAATALFAATRANRTRSATSL